MDQPAETVGEDQSQSGSRRNVATDLEFEESLVRTLTRYAAEADIAVDLEKVKSAVRHSSRAHETDLEARAQRAAEAVGFALSFKPRTFEKLVAALSRAPVLIFDDHGCLLIREVGPNTYDVLLPSGVEVELEADEFMNRLRIQSPSEKLSVGFIHPLAAVQTDTPSSDPERLTPIRRLLGLYRPEREDIRTIIVFASVVGILSLATPIAVESIVNTIAFTGLVQPIIVLSIVLFIVLGLAAFIVALESFIIEMIQRRIFVRVGLDLAWRLPRVQREAFDARHGPELVNRFFDVATVQKLGSKLLLDGTTAVLSAAMGLLVLAFYHPILLAFDVILLCALGVIIFGIGRGSIRTAVKESAAKYAVADWLEELARHPLSFRNAGGREIAIDHADTLLNRYLDNRKRHFRIVYRQLVTALFLQVITTTGLILIGGWLVTQNELDLGRLVAAWLIVSLVLAAVSKLGSQLESFYDLSAAADKLGNLFDLPLERDNGEALKPLPGPAQLELQKVSVHSASGSSALENFSLTANGRQPVAILGPAGSGKTTLLEAIHGQREPAQGKILIDGVEIHSLRLESIRRSVALAQVGETIGATIAQNVRMRDYSLTLEEIRAALESVGLWQSVQNLPKGSETELTSDGRPLSPSQCALLVLARVIASRPRLLLVDGIFDALGEEQAKSVFEYLSAPENPWTLVVATQRAEIASLFPTVVDLEPASSARSDGPEDDASGEARRESQ